MASAVAGPSKAATASTSSAVLSLHPLPILSISEHIVRSRAQQGGSAQPLQVYGALLGTQSGRHLEVQNTFEVKVDAEGRIDEAFFKSRQAQYKQTFPTFDFLGWYSNGTSPTQRDLAVHKQFLEHNESPLFLQFSPSADLFERRDGRGHLPIQVYESQMAVAPAGSTSQSAAAAAATTSSADASSSTAVEAADVDSAPSSHLILVESSGYRIETAEAERIAVDYVSKPAGAQGSEGEHGAVISSLEGQQSAIRMLHSRIQVAHRYVASLLHDSAAGAGSSAANGSNGATPPAKRDHEALRQLKSILSSMPRDSAKDPARGDADEEDDDGFRIHFLREYNDALLVASLSRMTQGMRTLNEYVDKFDLMQQGKGGAGGGGGGGDEGGFGWHDTRGDDDLKAFVGGSRR